MKKLYAILLMGFAVLSAQGQNQAISGRVLDTDNFPLPGATVKAEKSNVAVISDIDGYFTLTAITAASEKVIVSYVGFETQTQEVNLGEGQTPYLQFNMVSAVNELSEVVVSGYQAGINKAINKQRTDLNVSNIISADQVGKFPDANIGDALKRVPGISMQNDQGEARNIIIRGFAPELNAVTLNLQRGIIAGYRWT